MIEDGVDINIKDEHGESPLFHAVFYGMLEMCEFLLENGAKVNAKSHIGKNALHWAVEKGHTAIC